MQLLALVPGVMSVRLNMAEPASLGNGGTQTRSNSPLARTPEFHLMFSAQPPDRHSGRPRSSGDRSSTVDSPVSSVRNRYSCIEAISSGVRSAARATIEPGPAPCSRRRRAR